jgi:hypothetical protein
MKFNLSNKLYDALNNLVKLVLPAVGTLYFSLAAVWDLPHGEQVVGSLAAIATFFGVVLAFARKAWGDGMDGSLVIDQSNPDTDVYSLEVNTPFEDLANSEVVYLKVVKPV